MARSTAPLNLLRSICLSLPDTRETLTWGKPHFRVGEKIFAGYGEENGIESFGLKLEMAHARRLIAEDARFTRAPYVGHKGWVSIDALHMSDADELRALVEESYRLIAPKKSVAKLDNGDGTPQKPRARGRAGKKKRQRKISQPRAKRRT